MNRPINLSAEDLRLGIVSSMAVNEDSTRVYFGQILSYDRNRLNLAVLSLQPDGTPDGAIRRYPDSIDIPLPLGSRARVDPIIYSSKHKKLYLGINQENAKAVAFGRFISVYDLDSDGEPIGSPQTYEYPYMFDDKGPQNEILYSIVIKENLDSRYPDLLYFSGYGIKGLYIIELNNVGEPTPRTTKYNSKNGARTLFIIENTLFLGSTPKTLEVIQLNDQSGYPAKLGPRPLPFAPDGSLENLESDDESTYFMGYLKFIATKKALFWLYQGQIVYLPIEDTFSNGHYLPQTSTPLKFPGFSPELLISEPSSNSVWIASNINLTDAFNSNSFTSGYTAFGLYFDINNVLLRSDIAYPDQQLKKPVFAAIAPGGFPIILSNDIDPTSIKDSNEVKDYKIKVRLDKIEPKPDPKPDNSPGDIILSIHGENSVSITDVPISITPNTWTKPFNLDPILKDKFDQQLITIQIQPQYSPPKPITKLKISIEIEYDASMPPRQFIEEVVGPTVQLLIPGYKYGIEYFKYGLKKSRLSQIELLSEHSQLYLDEAQKVKVQEVYRPKQFIVSSFTLRTGQGSLTQLKKQAEALSFLGINTSEVSQVNIIADPNKGITREGGNLPPKDIDSTVKSFGINRRLLAVYSPTGSAPANVNYFDFVLHEAELKSEIFRASLMLQSTIDNDVKFSGLDINDLAIFQLADEPNWRYPDWLDRVSSNPDMLTIFRQYLQDKSRLSPVDFGVTNWSDPVLKPIGLSSAIDPFSRRLFYWTMRFFVESASRGIAFTQTILKEELKNQGRTNTQRIVSYANWNNILLDGGKWYSHDDKKQPDKTQPYDASGSFDWLDVGRVNEPNPVSGKSPLTSFNPWTSDNNQGDRSAQNWSYQSDLLRCSSMLGNRSFGGHLYSPSISGYFPAVVSYKILAMIGHGAKTVSMYAFGPLFFFRENSWSEKFYIYGQIASALELVGKAENLLFSGKPLRGKVAILMSHTSGLWDKKTAETFYNKESARLYYALNHAGYTIDFVDETDITNDELTSRDYKTLYITGPNLAEDAQEKIKAWVNAGGMLAVTPGAAVANQYNEPTNIFDNLLGLKSRTENRDLLNERNIDFEPQDEVVTFGNRLTLVGSIVKLQTNGAAEIGRLKFGGAGITINQYGAGRAIAYGFFPGLQYWQSQYWESPLYNSAVEKKFLDAELPKWGKAERDIAVTPARLANTPQPIELSHEVVEACRLETRDDNGNLIGIAVVLLNWTGNSIPSLTVTIPNAGSLQQVTSIQGSTIFKTATGDTVAVTLSLKDVDVLLVQS
jgi:hypothetical protein